jgi:hypothetical protein
VTGTDTVDAASMQQLLAQGRARPLLEGHFPVPVELDGQWWHVPADPPPGADPGVFVPAPARLAAQFERLAARRHAADEAARRAGCGPP